MRSLPNHRDNRAAGEVLLERINHLVSHFERVGVWRLETFLDIGLNGLLAHDSFPVGVKVVVLLNMRLRRHKHLEPDEFQPRALIAAQNLPDKRSLQAVGLNEDKRAFCFWMIRHTKMRIIRIRTDYRYVPEVRRSTLKTRIFLESTSTL